MSSAVLLTARHTQYTPQGVAAADALAAERSQLNRD